MIDVPGIALSVYREIKGEFEQIGTITEGYSSENPSAFSFTYADSYLNLTTAQAISRTLPLNRRQHSGIAVQAFFEGILPEGSLRKELLDSSHLEQNDLLALLAYLNNESSGALIFKTRDEEPTENRKYEPLSEEDVQDFAVFPLRNAARAAKRSRLSLAGAQTKIGLFFDVSQNQWCLPCGTAPSSHIVKACDGSFPGQTINEAICMATAAKLGFETAECRLLPVKNAEPLIAVRRFDRIDTGDRYLHRVHQEDFFQALPDFRSKYEPTDGHYANHCANLINAESTNPAGDRRFFFSRLLLDWAIGNADNHLKNHSFLWNEDWSAKTVSPLYDITCTTRYPEVDRTMGVSFGGSRRIDEVCTSDIVWTANQCGVGAKFASRELEQLLDEFPVALADATKMIAEEGFPEAQNIGASIAAGFWERVRFIGKMSK